MRHVWNIWKESENRIPKVVHYRVRDGRNFQQKMEETVLILVTGTNQELNPKC
jgi:hypothetical protein